MSIHHHRASRSPLTIAASREIDAYLQRRSAGETLSPEIVIKAHPELMPELGRQFEQLAFVEQAIDSAEAQTSSLDRRSRGRAGLLLPPDPGFFPGYTLTSEVHRGGQAVVYRAQQDSTRRDVAIKVLREGAFTDERDTARFEREVQVLGTLQHPNIITIHERGSTGGLTYFVMDYISGQPLDTYVHMHDLDIEDTLRLFEQICEAVHAAHLRGVIHRDLKPSNIRVDEHRVPHVLDFGLAKIVHPDGHRGTITMTETGHFVGSLPWASPEQASESTSDIDIRTDVYSLGVILYQLIVRRFPYDIGGSARRVLDHIAVAVPTRPRSIRSDVNDEVETIILKCLSKERERRYHSAGEIARDIRHYLNGEPIQAKRDSTWYVLRKTLRRYRVHAIAASVVMLLIIGTSITLYVMNRQLASTQRSASMHQKSSVLAANALAEVTSFGEIGMPNVNPEQLETATRRSLARLADDPIASAMLMESVSSVCQGLGFLDAAIDWRREALALRRQTPLSTRADIASSHHHLASRLNYASRTAEAEKHYREALRIRRALFGDLDADVAATLHSLASVMQRLGRGEEAVHLRREALRVLRALHPEPHMDVVEEIHALASYLANNGGHSNYIEAEQLLREALDISRRIDPPDPLNVARGELALASFLQIVARYDEAYSLRVRATATLAELVPNNSSVQAGNALDMGLLLKDMGDYEQAERLIRQNIEYLERLSRPTASSVGYAYNCLAKVYSDAGALDKAEEACRISLDKHIEAFGIDDRATARPMTHLGRILVRQGRCSEAVPYLRDALEIRLEKKPPGHWKTGKTLNVLGAAYAGLGRFEEAEPLLLEGLKYIEADRGPGHRRTLEAVQRVVDCYEAWGREDEAMKYRRRLDDAKQ